MFTSEEIRQITFEKGMRGYRPEDVESFIDKIADEFAALEKERDELQEKLYILAEKIEQYKSDEESIKTTLINAQRLGESIIADAKVKADTLEKESIKKKNNIIASAYAEIEGYENTVKKLQQEASDFKHLILGLYKEHIETLSKIPDVIPVEDADEETEPEEDVSVENASAEESTVEFELPAESEEPVKEVTEEEPEETSEKFNKISSLFDGE